MFIHTCLFVHTIHRHVLERSICNASILPGFLPCLGYEVTTLEEVVERAHLFVTTTGATHILRPEHMLRMRENAILCNMGHFDQEIDVGWLKKNCQRSQIKPQVSCV